MDDIASTVVGPAHEIGSWRGPARSPWVQRIAHGAGFGVQWDLNRLADEPAAGGRPGDPTPLQIPAAPVDDGTPADDGPPATPSLRLWWLPSAHEG